LGGCGVGRDADEHAAETGADVVLRVPADAMDGASRRRLETGYDAARSGSGAGRCDRRGSEAIGRRSYLDREISASGGVARERHHDRRLIRAQPGVLDVEDRDVDAACRKRACWRTIVIVIEREE